MSPPAAARGSAAAGWLVLGLAFLVRAPVLPDSVVDWDESLYLLVADSILSGHLPYERVWDHKPPGIYYLFAGARALWPGDPVVAIRLLGSLCVGLGGVAVLRLHALLWPGLPGGAFAALLYVLLASANGGLATNTEIVFGALLLLGAWACVAGLLGGGGTMRRHAACAAGGLAFGVALAVKYVVALDLLGFAILWAVLVRRVEAPGRGGRSGLYLSTGAVIAGGAGVALALFAAPFVWAGAWDSLVANAFLFNLGYGGGGLHGRGLLRSANALLAFAGALLPAAVLLVARPEPHGPGRGGEVAAALGAWAVLSLASPLVQARFFPHHFLQVLPVACLLAGAGFAVLARSVPARSRDGSRPGVAVLATLLLLLGLVAGPLHELGWRGLEALREASHGDWARTDVPRQVARWIRPRLAPGESLYVYNHQHVIYDLAGARIPTRFPFSLHLLIPDGPSSRLVDARAEVRRILAGRPRFVVVREGRGARRPQTVDPVLSEALAAGYREAVRFPVWTRPERDPGEILFVREPSEDAWVAVYERRPASLARPRPRPRR